MRILLLLAMVVLGACTEKPATSQVSSDALRPNIIHIMADDLGYAEVGAFGQAHIKTPHIDQLAREGMTLTQHYAGSALCSPSRWAYMTGKHAGSTGITENGYNVLPKDSPTIARVLQSAGYTTALAGKWALGIPGSSGDPLRQGFDTWFGYRDQSAAHNYYPEHLYEDGKVVPLPGNTPSPHKHVAAKKKQYAPDAIQAWAKAFIARASAAQPLKPFYLQLDLNLPHLNNELREFDGVGAEVRGTNRYADKDWPEKHKGYAEMVSLIDDYVGDIITQLSSLGIEQKTLVIFTSDNGPTGARGIDSLGFFRATATLRGMKGMLLEGGIRAPTVVRWPGRVPAGSSSDVPSAFWDMLPTFAALAGDSHPLVSDGVSMVGVWQGQQAPARVSPLYWQVGNWTALREGDWKWLRFDGPQGLVERLYNVVDDPSETQDKSQINSELFSRLRDKATTLSGKR